MGRGNPYEKISEAEDQVNCEQLRALEEAKARAAYPGHRRPPARPPERREVPAEVQFEIASDTVTVTTDLGVARAVGVPNRLSWAFAAASASRSNEARRWASVSTSVSRSPSSTVRFKSGCVSSQG